jgi:signal transduction histidine kinase
MIDKEQNSTPSMDEITENEYAEISQKADNLFRSNNQEKAIKVLKTGLTLTQYRGHKAYELFFQGELAHYEKKNDQDALTLEQESADIKNYSGLILQSTGDDIFSHLEKYDEALEKSIKLIPLEAKKYLLDQIIAKEERNKAEQEARDRKIRLDAWQRLSARAAHRIGNQLFASRGALKTLEEQNDPDIKEATSDLLDAINQIQRLNQQFKKFSANENPRFEEVSVNDLVETILRRYKGQSEEKKVDFKMIPTEIKTWSMDRLMMEETLGELMENALYHTNPGGKITLEAEEESLKGKPALKFVVENTGEGIRNEFKEKIFEAFFTTKPQGTGLGLAIVKKFIELHNGTIRETGTPGKSTRFEILIPKRESKEATKT